MCIRDRKYNLPLHTSNFSRKHIIAEILNAETVVKAISDQQEQNKMRFLINDKFNKIIERHNINKNIRSVFSTNYNKERKTLVNLKKKLTDNHALVTKADKGNTVVIMDTNTYNEIDVLRMKLNEFEKYIVDNFVFCDYALHNYHSYLIMT